MARRAGIRFTVELYEGRPEHEVLLTMLRNLPRSARGKTLGVTDFFVSLANQSKAGAAHVKQSGNPAPREEIVVQSTASKDVLEARVPEAKLDFSKADFG